MNEFEKRLADQLGAFLFENIRNDVNISILTNEKASLERKIEDMQKENKKKTRKKNK